jgi:hypothetical protein
MKQKEEEESRYFQSVNRCFLELRGSPFFLTPREVDMIKEWKKIGIPLHIVQDGIKDFFAVQRKRPGRKRKMTSLAFCHPFVLRSYEAHKERIVGGKRRPHSQENKREELKKAVEEFLETCPKNYPNLRQVFSRALNLISRDSDEELLEELENEVETLAIGMISVAEREQIRNEVQAEFPDRSSHERERIQQLKEIKRAREKYAIPHISLFYY